MSDENYLKEVREHYENYPYPPIDPEEERERLYMPILEAFDRMNYFAFEGRRNFNDGFRVLVAGGGTGDAIIALAEQLRDTNADVYYIDMSESSMALAKKRAEIRGLTNITWIRDSLLNLPTLNVGMFDYINCSGVLHHLSDPDLGLSILASLLKDDGAMGIMIYAKYGRTSVYQMQDTLRIINRDEPNLQTRVDNAKKILNHLPSTNWFLYSPDEMISEIKTDAGIYDLLLHSQDRSYSIPELYEYLEKQGLTLLHLLPDYQAFGDRLYDPVFYINDPVLEAKVKALPIRDQQALAELLHGKIIKHTFYTAKTPRTAPAYGDLDLIPHLAIDMELQRDNILTTIRETGDVVQLEQAGTGVRTAFVKGPHLEPIMKALDGKRSLREIFRIVIDGYNGRKGAPNYQQLLEEFAYAYKALNTYYWMFLRHPSSSQPIAQHVMQSRVKPA